MAFERGGDMNFNENASSAIPAFGAA